MAKQKAAKPANKKATAAKAKKTPVGGVQPFLSDVQSAIKKHGFSDHNVFVKLTARPAEAGGCQQVWVDDGQGGHCFKCIGDMSPCP